MPHIGILYIHLQIPGTSSLKEKRTRLKPLMAHLHREYNLSVAEIDHQDTWDECIITCAAINSDRVVIEKCFEKVRRLFQTHFQDMELIDDTLEWV